MNYINNITTEKNDYENIDNNEFKYTVTEKNNLTLLDYTFAYQSTLINEGSITDPLKIKNYHNDLQETFSLNIDMLKNIKNFHIYNVEQNNNNINTNNIDKTKEINDLINTIIEKNENKKKKINTIKLIKQKILNKKQIFELTRLNFEKNKINTSIKIDEITNLLNSKTKYIQIMFQRLNFLNTYLNQIKNDNKNEYSNTINIENFFNLNNKYNLSKKNLNNEIQLIVNKLKIVRKDNEIYNELKSIYKEKKPNINLIRVVNFYIEYNDGLIIRNKINKKRLDKFLKILNFLNYQDIGNFAISQNDLSVTHYEMNFSKVGYENVKEKKHNKEEDEFNLIEKINKLMDFQNIINTVNKKK